MCMLLPKFASADTAESAGPVETRGSVDIAHTECTVDQDISEPPLKKRKSPLSASQDLSTSPTPAKVPIGKLGAETLMEIFDLLVGWVPRGVGWLQEGTSEVDKDDEVSGRLYRTLAVLTSVCRFWRSSTQRARYLWSWIDFSLPNFSAHCLAFCGTSIRLHVRGRVPADWNPLLPNQRFPVDGIRDHFHQIDVLDLSASTCAALSNLLKAIGNGHTGFQNLTYLRLSSDDSSQPIAFTFLPDMPLGSDDSGQSIALAYDPVIPLLQLPCLVDLVLQNVVLQLPEQVEVAFPALETFCASYSDVYMQTLLPFVAVLKNAPALRVLDYDMLQASEEYEMDSLMNLRDLANRSSLSLPLLVEICLQGLEEDITSELSNYLQVPAVKTTDFVFSEPYEVAEFIHTEGDSCNLVKAFKECKCDLHLSQTMQPYLRSPDLRLFSLGTADGHLTCSCPRFSGILEPEKRNLGEIQSFVTWVTDIIGDSRIRALTLPLSQFGLVDSEALVLDLPQIFRLMPQLETLILTDVDPWQEVTHIMAGTLMQVDCFPNLRRLDVNHTESTWINDLTGIAALYRTDWDMVVEACSSLQTLEFNCIPSALEADNKWKAMCHKVRLLLSNRIEQPKVGNGVVGDSEA